MDRILASALSAVLRLQNIATALVLAAFLGAALRAFLRAALGERLLPKRSRRPGLLGRRRLLVSAAHMTWGLFALGFGALYGVFVASGLEWSASAILVAGFTLLAILGSLAFERLFGWKGVSGLTGLLLRAVLALTLIVLALVTLMRAGFLALTEDRPVLLVELTGATAAEEVRWAPPGGAARVEKLTTHQIVFRQPADGVSVGEAWIYGDEIAVKGRVLRLAPILNAAGIPNLFEIQFAFNGYRTIERHNSYPHHAYAIKPVGPLAVHPLWRRYQERLLALWESGTDEGSAWVVRSTTTESTFFPMAETDGRAVKRVYRLVMTPGGLSAS
jgi:hypothetical protein